MEETSPASSSSSSTAAPPSATANTASTGTGANHLTPPPMILTRLPNPPTLVEHSGMRFLIMDAPTDGNLPLYLQEMQRNGVTDCVRLCEPTYAKRTVQAAGIQLHDWSFPDGESPPDSIVAEWLRLVEAHLAGVGGDGAVQERAIACHCVAGLGRAPVLVAIALIEFGSMSALDAITFVRSRRRGAINNKQLKFLEAYHPRKRPSRRCAVQ